MVEEDDDPPEDRRERRARRARRRQSFSVGIFWTFAIVLGFLTFVVFAGTGWFVHATAKSALEDQLNRRLVSVAGMVAREIQGEPGDEDSAALVGRLRQDRWTSDRARTVELCRRARATSGCPDVIVCDRSLRVLATADTPANATASEAAGGKRVEFATMLDAHKATLERVVVDRVPAYTPLYFHQPTASPASSPPEAGRYYAVCYAPVLLPDPVTRRDEVVLFVGVDYPPDFTDAVENVDHMFILLGAGAFVAVLASAMLLLRQRVQLPIYRLVRAMEGGDDAPVPGRPVHARARWPDEIGALTEHYNSMVDRLGTQEGELRRLADEAKKRAEFLTGYSKYLVEGVPTAVVAVAPDQSVTVWNEAAQKMLGKGPEAVGQPLASVLEPESPVARALLAALRGEVTDQAFVGLGGKGDAEAGETDQDEAGAKLVELAAGPFHTPETGAILGAAALVHDRTELERLRRAAARNERLAAVGHLAAGLAHEIRNPLGAISGFAELLERKKGEDAARLAARLRGEVLELNRFVTEFLSFARDEKIKRAPEDVGALVRRSAETALGAVGYTAEETKLLLEGQKVSRPKGELRVEIEEDPLLKSVPLDGTALKAALVNIAKNAVEAMEQKGVLSLRARLSEDRLVIRIRDTGPGVAPELREKIFDPFFTTRDSGTGLGLAIAHKIVAAHGGKIAVRAPDEGGCEFVVRIPVTDRAAASEGPRPIEADLTPLNNPRTKDIPRPGSSARLSAL